MVADHSFYLRLMTEGLVEWCSLVQSATKFRLSSPSASTLQQAEAFSWWSDPDFPPQGISACGYFIFLGCVAIVVHLQLSLGLAASVPSPGFSVHCLLCRSCRESSWLGVSLQDPVPLFSCWLLLQNSSCISWQKCLSFSPRIRNFNSVDPKVANYCSSFGSYICIIFFLSFLLCQR